MQNESLRNIAIIAHVDHGKTTLVDEMLKQGGAFRENQEVKDRPAKRQEIQGQKTAAVLHGHREASFRGQPVSLAPLNSMI